MSKYYVCTSDAITYLNDNEYKYHYVIYMPEDEVKYRLGYHRNKHVMIYQSIDEDITWLTLKYNLHEVNEALISPILQAVIEFNR